MLCMYIYVWCQYSLLFILQSLYLVCVVLSIFICAESVLYLPLVFEYGSQQPSYPSQFFKLGIHCVPLFLLTCVSGKGVLVVGINWDIVFFFFLIFFFFSFLFFLHFFFLSFIHFLTSMLQTIIPCSCTYTCNWYLLNTTEWTYTAICCL